MKCNCKNIAKRIRCLTEVNDADYRYALGVGPTAVLKFRIEFMAQVNEIDITRCTCFVGEYLRQIEDLLTTFFKHPQDEYDSIDLYNKNVEKTFDKLMKILYNIRDASSQD
jgi:hypothetical protein